MAVLHESYGVKNPYPPPAPPNCLDKPFQESRWLQSLLPGLCKPLSGVGVVENRIGDSILISPAKNARFSLPLALGFSGPPESPSILSPQAAQRDGVQQGPAFGVELPHRDTGRFPAQSALAEWFGGYVGQNQWDSILG